MLVLTRKQGQALFIGDEIEIVVVEVRGDQVRLGIRAPHNVSIVRREVLDDIVEANREAAANDPTALDAMAGRPGPAPDEPEDGRDDETGSATSGP